MAKILKDRKIIIWVECTMAHKTIAQALNWTLKYLSNNPDHFGGTMILLADDFLQTLPITP